MSEISDDALTSVSPHTLTHSSSSVITEVTIASVRTAVVVPCFNVAQTFPTVAATIPDGVWRIYCVNDCSTDRTAEVIEAQRLGDTRIRSIPRDHNGGVGAAFLTGMMQALEEGAEIIIKVDGDGQMNGAFAADFAAPILKGEADFVKGNRFFDIERVLRMPKSRLIGNAGMSFFSKLSTGYWHLFDPANGYVAIHADVARLIPVEKVHKRYFFESDLLFRLAILRAVVVELPIESVYGDEISGVSEWHSLATFPLLHLRNFMKRIAYNYVLRGFSLGSIALLMGLPIAGFGLVFGAVKWWESYQSSEPATAGTVMLSALPIIIGIQFILNFLAQDMAAVPDRPVHLELSRKQTLMTPCREQPRV